MVLRRGERQYALIAGDDDEADFFAGQKFLDDYGLTGAAETAAEHAGGGLDGRLVGLADDDALAGREPVGLDDHGQALCPDIVGIEGVFGKGGVARGWYAVALQEILGVRLRPFQARRGAGGAEASAASRGEAIDDTGNQRTFGTDDGESDVLTRRECEQGVDIIGRDGDVADLGLERGARVAGSDEHLIYPRRLSTFPSQRVFAAAAADDQDFHRRGSRHGERFECRLPGTVRMLRATQNTVARRLPTLPGEYWSRPALRADATVGWRTPGFRAERE